MLGLDIGGWLLGPNFISVVAGVISALLREIIDVLFVQHIFPAAV